MKTLSDRFHNKWMPEPNSGCWLWTGAYSTGRTNSHTRPWIGAGKRSEGNLLAHRASWMLHEGAIPSGMEVCHRCDVPLCVNPSHLFLGSHQENMADCGRKGRRVGRGGLKGEAHNLAKLNERQVVQIRRSVGTLKQMSAIYGVSITQISDIRRHKSWRHVK